VEPGPRAGAAEQRCSEDLLNGELTGRGRGPDRASDHPKWVSKKGPKDEGEEEKQQPPASSPTGLETVPREEDRPADPSDEAPVVHESYAVRAGVQLNPSEGGDERNDECSDIDDRRTFQVQVTIGS